jgi:hypothetical protein
MAHGHPEKLTAGESQSDALFRPRLQQRKMILEKNWIFLSFAGALFFFVCFLFCFCFLFFL